MSYLQEYVNDLNVTAFNMITNKEKKMKLKQ